jgi:hypothetical protein
MKLKWIYWVSTGLLAAIYLGGGTLYLSNISGVTSRNKFRPPPDRRPHVRAAPTKENTDVESSHR